MPVEFQTGTYRMGHSMVRPSYRANLAGDNGQPFFGFIFDPVAGGQGRSATTCAAASRAPRRFVGWQTFFDFGDGEVKPNKQIDTKISTPLFTLPLGAIASHDAPTALPQRNLLRHLTWQLPSGQAVARAMGVTPLAATDLAGAGAARRRLRAQHAAVVLRPEGGRGRWPTGCTSGPVGGRIVAEVFIGLLQTDPASYLAPSRAGGRRCRARTGRSAMTDFLTFAGVDPTSRGQ